MSETTLSTPGSTAFGDYLSLTKPRINILVLVTTFVGFWLAAPGLHNASTLWLTMLGTALTVGGASALNCYQESDVDAHMDRTRDRPLPAGRVVPFRALVFGISCSLAGLVLLYVGVNPLCAALALLALVTYVPVYTTLKKHTSLSTLIGAVPGAIPPMIGWTAVEQSLDLPALLLFLIMFVWQPPHFLALALLRADEYDRANLSMLPVEIHPSASHRQIVLYVLSLLPLSLLPSLMGLTGPLYFYTALVLGGGFLLLSIVGLFPDHRGLTWARWLFVYSILYLTLLFGVLVMDARPVP